MNRCYTSQIPVQFHFLFTIARSNQVALPSPLYRLYRYVVYGQEFGQIVIVLCIRASCKRDLRRSCGLYILRTSGVARPDWCNSAVLYRLNRLFKWRAFSWWSVDCWYIQHTNKALNVYSFKLSFWLSAWWSVVVEWRTSGTISTLR